MVCAPVRGNTPLVKTLYLIPGIINQCPGTIYNVLKLLMVVLKGQFGKQ